MKLSWCWETCTMWNHLREEKYRQLVGRRIVCGGSINASAGRTVVQHCHWPVLSDWKFLSPPSDRLSLPLEFHNHNAVLENQVYKAEKKVWQYLTLAVYTQHQRDIQTSFDSKYALCIYVSCSKNSSSIWTLSALITKPKELLTSYKL